jgi:hypothetical protein
LVGVLTMKITCCVLRTGVSARKGAAVGADADAGTPNSSLGDTESSSSHFDLQMDTYEDQVNDVLRIRHDHDHRPRGEHEPGMCVYMYICIYVCMCRPSGT